ncbi:hypothetical protein JWS13_23465 [Rhodococcus pseudokoreensis]|uniref:Lactonase, 7-bladed beta-propeller n=1 Tax=Rhodococcus pseudokoreensis TaxID=2811421 RepID=A0A974W5G4_9NOCA|nr:hypothetical protein [Rhodococcus pseudokoreensis]QSE91381.1 hypothetical protein JWS13_23465 [Rhodococcus pseudokoreensis]
MRRSPFTRLGRRAAIITGALILATAVAAAPATSAMPAANTLYVTENGTGSVLSVPATGGTPGTVATGIAGPGRDSGVG